MKTLGSGQIYWKHKQPQAMFKKQAKKKGRSINATSIDKKDEVMPQFIPQEPPMEHYSPPLRAPPR